VRKDDDSTFREIIERMEDGVLLLDLEARCLHLNPAALRLVGKPEAETLGRIMWEALPGPVGTSLCKEFDRLKAGERVQLLRSHFAHGRWYDAVASPFTTGILIVVRDITERLEAEAERRQSNELFQLLVDRVGDYAIFALNLKGQVATWNKGAERIKGYAPREIIGKHFSIFYPPEDVKQQVPQRELEIAIAEGHVEAEGWRVRKDGSRFWASVVITLLRDDLGDPRGFAKITRDMTEQMRTQEALREAAERLRLAVDSAEIGTWEVFPQTGKVAASGQAKVVIGLSPDDEVTYEGFLARVHPDDRRQVDEAVRRAHDPESGGEYEIEYRTIGLRDGVERWVAARGKAYFDESGRPARFLGVARDVTGRHRIDELRDLLPAFFAHDLRSPLSAIKLSSELLLRGGDLPARTTKSVGLIARNAAHMGRMVERLLDISRARLGGGIPLDRVETSLADVCGALVLDTQTSHPERVLRFNVQGNTVGWWDPTRLTEVASNLIDNALKHGAPDQPIDLALRDEGAGVVMEVHNGGAAIPEEVLPFVFDIFRRGAVPQGEAAPGAGLGLGLYIAREIVVAHGGRITGRSSAQEGTTFTVHLPRGQGASIAPRPTA
jgi:PAS domain S-box-containing protein